MRHQLAIVLPDRPLGGFVGLVACDRTARLVLLAMESAAQQQPLVDARLEAGLIPLVGLEIVGRDASGRAVDGYRAPSFSITKQSLWALDVLIEEGHRYPLGT